MKQVFLIAITVILGGFFANLLYFIILNKHESSVVSALIYSSPVFTLVLAMLFAKEKVSIVGIMGIILITLGVICIAFNEKRHGRDGFVDVLRLDR